MLTIVHILLMLAGVAIVAVLGMGIYSMARGRKVDAERSAKLMRYRIMLQAAAIGLLLLAIILQPHK